MMWLSITFGLLVFLVVLAFGLFAIFANQNAGTFSSFVDLLKTGQGIAVLVAAIVLGGVAGYVLHNYGYGEHMSTMFF